MKILISGANGQVGHELLKQGTDSIHHIIALERQALDITSLNEIWSAFESHKPDLMINAAAYTAVDKAESEMDLAYQVNSNGPANLAEVCASYGIPLLHISTDYVFDGSDSGAYVETDPVSPLGVYGQSKWQGEEAIRQKLERYIILRTSWVFSHYGNNFVKTILRIGSERDELRVVNDQHGAPTSAEGIAKALLMIVDKIDSQPDYSLWGTYHYCGYPFTNWHAFAEEIILLGQAYGLIHHPVKVLPIPGIEYLTPAARPSNSQLSCTKIIKAFDIQPDNWKEALQKVVASMSAS